MSDVPLTRTTLRTAQPVAAQPRPRPLLRAKPLVENATHAKPVTDGDTVVVDR